MRKALLTEAAVAIFLNEGIIGELGIGEAHSGQFVRLAGGEIFAGIEAETLPA